MALEDTLNELERRRAGFKDRQAKIDEELKARRAAMLADEVNAIEDLIAKAIAENATLGQIKRKYGTKDHRTITTIVARRQGEIQYWRDAIALGEVGKEEWFTIQNGRGGNYVVSIEDVMFDIHILEDGTIMLSTETPQWNEDFTVENETVREYDGKTEEDNPRIAEISEAFYGRS